MFKPPTLAQEVARRLKEAELARLDAEGEYLRAVANRDLVRERCQFLRREAEALDLPVTNL